MHERVNYHLHEFLPISALRCLLKCWLQKKRVSNFPLRNIIASIQSLMMLEHNLGKNK